MTLKKSFALGAGGRTGWGLSLDDKPWRASTDGMTSAILWRPVGRAGRGGESMNDSEVFNVGIVDLELIRVGPQGPGPSQSLCERM